MDLRRPSEREPFGHLLITNPVSLQFRGARRALLVHTESDEIQHSSREHSGYVEPCHSGKGANTDNAANNAAGYRVARSYTNTRGPTISPTNISETAVATRRLARAV